LCDVETQSDLRDPCILLLNLGSAGNTRDNVSPNTYKFLEGRCMQKATHNDCFIHVYTENMSSNSTAIASITVIMTTARMFCRN
jgi:hypothetical protein